MPMRGPNPLLLDGRIKVLTVQLPRSFEAFKYRQTAEVRCFARTRFALEAPEGVNLADAVVANDTESRDCLAIDLSTFFVCLLS